MPLLLCEDVSIGYEGVAVASGLNFSVMRGDYLCILGENGAGKSTLMRCILGLKAPLSGSIRTGDGLKQTEIGYLPQQSIIQKDFPASVWEVVLSGCLNQKGWNPFYPKELKQRAMSALEKLDIGQFKNHSYRQLSGGQQQR